MRLKKAVDEQITEEKLQMVLSGNNCSRLSTYIVMQKHQVQHK